MSERIEILNGDDRALALRKLKTAAGKASGAARTHLLSVLRSLNPDAARSRAFKGASSMKKGTKKAAHSKGHKHTTKHNPTPGTGMYQLRSVATKAKAHVSAAGKRAASNFKTADIMGLLTEGVGVGLGLVGTGIITKQADKFLPASIPAVVKSAIATGIVGGLAVAMGGTKGFTRYVAVGSIGEFLQSVARTYLPAGIMAGTDEDVPTGYWDEYGQWIDGRTVLSGVVYDPAYAIPVTDERPAGM